MDDEKILSDEEFVEFHNERYIQLPRWIKEKSINFLKEYLTESDIFNIQQLYDKNKYSWASPFHFSYGMSIRNQLRDNVCLDDKLSDDPEYQNWNDYYVKLLEIAAGCY